MMEEKERKDSGGFARFRRDSVVLTDYMVKLSFEDQKNVATHSPKLTRTASQTNTNVAALPIILNCIQSEHPFVLIFSLSINIEKLSRTVYFQFHIFEDSERETVISLNRELQLQLPEVFIEQAIGLIAQEVEATIQRQDLFQDEKEDPNKFSKKAPLATPNDIRKVSTLRRIGYCREAQDLYRTLASKHSDQDTTVSQYPSSSLTGVAPSIDNIDTILAVAKLYMDNDQSTEAQLVLQDILKTSISPSLPLRLKVARLLCKVLERQGKIKEAETVLQDFCKEIDAHIAGIEQKAEEAMLQENLELSQQFLKESTQVQEQAAIPSLDTLAKFYVRHNELENAVPVLNKAIELRSKLNGPDHISLCDPLHQLSEIRVKQGQIKDAEQHLVRAVRIAEKTLQTTENVAKEVGNKPNSFSMQQAQSASRRIFNLRRLLMTSLTLLIALYDHRLGLPSGRGNQQQIHNIIREQFTSLLPSVPTED